MAFPASAVKPVVIIDLTGPEESEDEKEKDESQDEPYLCPICVDRPEDPVSTHCGHVFCNECMKSALRHSASCPLCKAQVLSTIRLYV
ncbi:E3 ubiquitin-protein ligase RNF4-like [Drosophila ficusphila]|uniref:E3 ubiquitin-protein ligase RNF4-like n=1 Tax=Drosophila ficusphila TaxID=30025 RepID=UPI0007E880D3|nr:E3 ubiquitin-protein ligase RNF4-like [Drosophila ficusphila]